MKTKRKRSKAPAGPRERKPRRTAAPDTPEPLCSESECGRPAYARGLCQTHHRQWLTTGKTKPIRPYRAREPGTVKFSGLRLTKDCAQKLERDARRKRISRSSVIAEVLEQWHAASRKGGDT
jgi:hypothetical protein